MPKNIIIVGNGFISSHLQYKSINDRLYCSNKQIRSILEKYKPDYIVNCIGYCGENNIDQCIENKEKTLISNIIIPTILANECNNLNIRCIMIGSGCIFNGESKHISVSLDGPKDNGWRETDLANPISFYSRTKYACDLAISSLPNVCVLRIRMPVSGIKSPRNLIGKLISYKQVVEEPNSMTFMEDLRNAVDWAISKEKSGVYHIAHPQPIKHSEILEEYRKYRPEHQYDKITVEELAGIVKEPRSNCVLDVSKATNEGFWYCNVRAQISECVRQFCIGD